MLTIDAHVHVFPPKIAPAAVRATAEFYAGAHTPEFTAPPELSACAGTAEDLLIRSAAAGIDRSVIFSTATRPGQVESVNNFIAGLCRDHPEFIGVGTMHIDYPDYETEVTRIRSMGLRGVKIHPDIQRFSLDDERLLPLYDLMRSDGLFLIAHTGDYRYPYSTPDKMERIARLFPEMRFIGAHFGGWSQWREARERLALPNVWVDTSSTLPFGAESAARAAFDAFDHEHIFFGSDYPMWDPGTELKRLDALALPEELLRAVKGENFRRFLEEG